MSDWFWLISYLIFAVLFWAAVDERERKLGIAVTCRKSLRNLTFSLVFWWLVVTVATIGHAVDAMIPTPPKES